jgi:hypothetical protein
MDRLDIDELDDAVLIEPAEKTAGGPVIGHSGVLVADRRSKERQKTSRRLIAALAIAAGTASELCIAGARIGDAISMTAGTPVRSALMPAPDMQLEPPHADLPRIAV